MQLFGHTQGIEQIDVVNGQTAAFLVNKLFLRQAVQAARFASGVNNIQHEQLVVPLEQIENVIQPLRIMLW